MESNDDIMIMYDIKQKIQEIYSYIENEIVNEMEIGLVNERIDKLKNKNVEINNIYNAINKYLENNCIHNFVDDYIDTSPESGKNIVYCTHCFQTMK